MQLEIDCTWKNKTKKGTLFITYDQKPKSIFGLKEIDFSQIKELEVKSITQGPDTLDEWEKLLSQFPKSPYAHFCYFKILRTLGLPDKATAFFQKMEKKFPSQVLIKCIKGHYLLDEEKTDAFSKIFHDEDVLLGAFKRRKIFHYEEGILFHEGWNRYYTMENHPQKAASHEKFIGIVWSGLQSSILSKK